MTQGWAVGYQDVAVRHQGRAAMVVSGRVLWAQRGWLLGVWQLPASPVRGREQGCPELEG